MSIFKHSVGIAISPVRELITNPLKRVYAHRYAGKYGMPRHTFAFDIALVLIGIGIGITALYFGMIYKPYDPVNGTLIISPRELISGGQAVARMRIENNSAEVLDNVSVQITIPANITISSISLPFDAEKKTITFGTIEAGAIAEARITGTITGAVGTTHRASAIMTYTNRRTGRVAHKTHVVSITISRSAIGGTFILPENILAGAEIEGSIRYQNLSNGAAARIVVVPQWPEGFMPTYFGGAPVHQGAWRVGTIGAHAEGTLTFRGVLRSATQSALFRADIAEENGKDILTQGHFEKNIPVTDSRITVRVSAQKTAAVAGETIPLTVFYENKGELIGKNTQLILTDSNGSRTIKPIGDLAPGVSGSASTTTRVTLSNNVTDPSHNVRATIRFEVTKENKTTVSIVSPTLQIKVASSLGLSAVARYYSEGGDQLGRGPLPPTVGQPTKYWIFWNTTNTFGTVANVRVSAKLPANVSWSGKASVPYGDPIQFDPATRTLTWSVGEVSPRPGINGPAIGAAFEVSLIPSPDQVGTSPLLILNERITGTDATTGLTVSGNAPSLTTALPADAKAAGKGKVIQ